MSEGGIERVERLPDYLDAASKIGQDALRAALEAGRERQLDPEKLIRLVGDQLTTLLEPWEVDDPDEIPPR